MTQSPQYKRRAISSQGSRQFTFATYWFGVRTSMKDCDWLSCHRLAETALKP